MAQKTKKQHYVPQCYLKAWQISDKKYQVYVYDKTLDSIRINNIEDIASERYFYDINLNDFLTDDVKEELKAKGYTLNFDENSQGIEHAFSEIVENAFSKHLQEIIENVSNITPWYKENCYFITEQKKADFSTYLALQFIRGKHIRNGIEDSADCLSQVLQDMGASQSVIDQYGISSKSESKNIHVSMLMDAEHIVEFAKIFFSHIWMLGLNKSNKKLYTSDSPICTHAHVKHSFLSMNGLASKGVEVFYPISPDILLIMLDRSYHTHYLSSERRYVELNSDNIDFYNSILAMEAERAIYSSDGDFKLINFMKRENDDIFTHSHTQVQWGGKTYYPRREGRQKDV